MAGFRTVRVTIGRTNRIAMHLLFHRTIELDSQADLCRLPEILRNESIADVHCLEQFAEATFAALETLPVNQRQSDRWEARKLLIDKLKVAKRLQDGGILVPDSISCQAVLPRTAIQQLGLPLMLKARVGNAGTGVALVRCEEELVRLVDAEGFTPAANHYERYMVGRPLNFSALAIDGDVIVAATHEITDRAGRFGPSCGIYSIEDPALEEMGRRTVEVLGLSGLVNIECIRDERGRDWVHDVNARVWGSCAGLRALGVDFIGSYVQWLLGETINTSQHLEPGVRLRLFPSGLGTELRSGHRFGAPYRLARLILRYRFLGARYIIFEIARQAQSSFWARFARLWSARRHFKG